MSAKRLELIREEPFRIFFPVGLLMGCAGVVLWPLFYVDWLGYYPAVAHTKLMILGFIGAFVVGFLGTAFPRLLGVIELSYAELIILGGSWFLGCFSCLLNWIQIADFCFILSLSVLLCSMVGRFFFREDTPPPGFVMVGASLISLWVSLFLNLLMSIGGLAIFPRWFTPFARDLQNIVFPSFILSGVAPYFFPKILGIESKHDFDESRKIPLGWMKHAVLAGLTAIVGLIGIFLKSMGLEWAGWIFVAVMLIYGLIEIPFIPSRPRWGCMSLGLGVGLVCFWLGLVLQMMFPQLRIGYFHLMMIAGIAHCMAIVSLRVIHGHAEVPEKTLGWVKWILWLSGLILLAALTRLFADVVLQIRVSHLIYAAVLWLVLSVIWFVGVRKLLLKSE